jgi:ectoine hydroxylase-related dioxygenase (phytanoyl-CoA dioxygenase family)
MAAVEFETAQADYGLQENLMQAYFAEGEQRALSLGNRGPIQFGADGSLDPGILNAYWETGFYTFTGVISPSEIEELNAGITDMLARAPVEKDAELDAQGRPALSYDRKAYNLGWVKPLTDPVGGTSQNGGRHPVKMLEPEVPQNAPEHVLQLILGSLQFSDACLRVSGHPQLLAVAQAINGEDFTPFNEVVWIKRPGLGGSVSWHQDGTTQWDRPDFDRCTHGYNTMVQLTGCTPANGLWVLPGSHVKQQDIKAMCDAAGSERLPDAVPLLCEPGDVAICNRQTVHGSFANTSINPRITVNFGFHRRASILGSTGNGIHSAKAVYDSERIFERSKMIAWAIDARKQHFPDEQAFDYQPFTEIKDQYPFDDRAREEMKDYNLRDLGI